MSQGAVDNPFQVPDSAMGGTVPEPDLSTQAAIEPAKPPKTAGHPHHVKRVSANALRKAKAATALFANANRPFVSGTTPAGYKHRTFVSQLAADLGGPEALSLAQRTMIDLAGRQMLLIDAVDAYVFNAGIVINRGKRSVMPVIRERASLVEGLRSILKDLGLERQSRNVPDLHAYMAGKAVQGPAPKSAAEPRTP